jgi:hypothetical protein
MKNQRSKNRQTQRFAAIAACPHLYLHFIAWFGGKPGIQVQFGFLPAGEIFSGRECF